jgi:hypothetical protein
MKTNQLMEIKIGEYGTLKIWHKDERVILDSVLEIVNNRRLKKDNNFKPLRMRDLLSKISLWQFIIELAIIDAENTLNHNGGVTPPFKISSDYSILDEYKDKKGRIKYTKLIKMFPNLIKSKRGKNGGTIVDLRIALKVASIVDKRIEAEIYTTIVKSNILTIRDEGGTSFKMLMDIVKKYMLDNKSDTDIIEQVNIIGEYGNYYSVIATLINKKVNKGFKKSGWNNKKLSEQEYRVKIHEKLITLIELGVVTDLISLKDYLKKI